MWKKNLEIRIFGIKEAIRNFTTEKNGITESKILMAGCISRLAVTEED